MVSNQFDVHNSPAGPFSFDTKKTDTLLLPSAKSIFPAAPPAYPVPNSIVDHYRCVKVKTTSGTTKFPKGVIVQVDDQFNNIGVRNVEITKPSKLCVATDKNTEGINRPDDHLLCYKVKSQPKTQIGGVQVNHQFGPFMTDLKGEKELCVPSTIQ